MNGEQQAPPKKENQKEKPCMCSKENIHEPDGCSKCRGENRAYLVQVSLLQEIPPNKRKRHKAFGVVKITMALILFMYWQMAALAGAFQIYDENIYNNAFLTIANFSFVVVAGWYFCGVILDKFGIIQ